MKPTILITGASTGIGYTTAIYFANKGWNVAATMRNPEKGKNLASVSNIKLYALDVMDPNSIKGALDCVIKDFGGVDAVFNNAGYALVGAFEAMSQEQIRRQFDTNVFGVMNVTKAILPYFRSKKGGTIINTSSMGGRITFPLYSVYHSTKWALEGFMESLQFELKRFNIRIYNIEPGAIKTEFGNALDFVSMADYDFYVQKAHQNMLDAYKKAPGPEGVASIVYKAATGGGFRLRFPASLQSSTLLFLRWLLPLKWFNALVAMQVEKGIK